MGQIDQYILGTEGDAHPRIHSKSAARGSGTGVGGWGWGNPETARPGTSGAGGGGGGGGQIRKGLSRASTPLQPTRGAPRTPLRSPDAGAAAHRSASVASTTGLSAWGSIGSRLGTPAAGAGGAAGARGSADEGEGDARRAAGGERPGWVAGAEARSASIDCDRDEFGYLVSQHGAPARASPSADTPATRESPPPCDPHPPHRTIEQPLVRDLPTQTGLGARG